MSFNAIHHYDLEKFFSEVYGSLKDDGHLFIYTRLRNQNYRSIWGEHFPLFADMENRLYELNELEEYVEMQKCISNLLECLDMLELLL